VQPWRLMWIRSRCCKRGAIANQADAPARPHRRGAGPPRWRSGLVDPAHNSYAAFMPPRLPNLFRSDPKNAARYYQIFLAKLLIQDRHEDVIDICRKIRRLAPPEYNKRNLSAYFLMEVASLAELKRYGIAWRQLRRAERVRWGRQLDLWTHRWRLEDTPLVTMHYVPLLYHRREYKLGRQLCERALAMVLRRGDVAEALPFIAGPQGGVPDSMFGVTLLHFYEALGEDIRLWNGWNKFIDGLPRRHFDGTEITAAHLKQDSTRLRDFIGKLIQKQNAENRRVVAEQQRGIRAFKVRNAARLGEAEAEIDRLFGAFL